MSEPVYTHHDMTGVIKAHVTEIKEHGHSVFEVREAHGVTRRFIRLGSAKLYLANKYV